MPERYLTGAIQKKPGRLYPESVRFIRDGCDIPFKPPTGHQRLVTIEGLRLKIGTEKNGGLVEGVANGKYNWVVAGEDMYEGLPDHLRDRLMIVRWLGFQFCQYRLGVWEGVSERFLVARGRGDTVKTLEDLKPSTAVATKREHVHYLGRVIEQRGLDLTAVPDSTPETAPDLRGIFVIADNYETGGTWRNLRPYPISPREVLLKSQAVLIRAKKLPWGMMGIFNGMFLPRVDRALANPSLWLNPQSESEHPELSASHRERDISTASVRRIGSAVALASI